jgi:hypothetical protein
LFLCLALFLCGKVSELSAGSLLSVSCDGLLFVFNFVELFDFGCCSLAQEMTFVVHYLPYFRQWLITHPVSVLLPFHALFTTISHSYQLLAPVPFSGVLSATLPPPLCASFQFLVYCTFFFFCMGFSTASGYASLSQGWLGEYHVILGAYLFGLLNVSQAGLEVASGSAAAICFLSVMWCGEVFYRLGVWSVEVLILFGALFLPSVAPVFQQDFVVTELTLSCSAP